MNLRISQLKLSLGGRRRGRGEQGGNFLGGIDG